MVYKIIGNFNCDNFESILKKVQKYFKFIYKDGSLYLALVDYQNKEAAFKHIKNTFRPARDFCIYEITEKNIMQENQFEMEWCRDNLVYLDLQRYELKEQEKLRQTMKAIDNFERIMEEQISQKKKDSTQDSL